MKQQSWSILLGSAIAVLASTAPAYAATHPTDSSTSIDQTIALLGNPPFPGEKGDGASRGGDAYAIAPGNTTGMNVIWHDRPLLIWEGAMSELQVKETATGKILWSQSVSSKDQVVAYTGESLKPGKTYEWVLWGKDYKEVDSVTFQIMKAAERDRITADLANLEARSRSSNATTEAIILERAQYFVGQKLWADVLMEAVLLEKSALTRDSDSLQNAKTLIKIVEHINRWTHILESQKDGNTQIHSGELQIQVLSGEGDRETAAQLGEPYQLKYKYNRDENDWEEPTFRVKLINNSKQTLFVGLLDIAQNFSIKSLLEKGAVRLEAGQAVWLDEGNPVEGAVPRVLLKRDVTAYSSIYKLMACTRNFDPTLFTQIKLSDHLKQDSKRPCDIVSFDDLTRKAVDKKNSNEKSFLESGLKLIGKVSKALYKEKDVPEEWVTQQIALTFICPDQPLDEA